MRDIKVYLLAVLRDANAGNRFDLTPVQGEAEALKAALVAFYDGMPLETSSLPRLTMSSSGSLVFLYR